MAIRLIGSCIAYKNNKAYAFSLYENTSGLNTLMVGTDKDEDHLILLSELEDYEKIDIKFINECNC